MAWSRMEKRWLTATAATVCLLGVVGLTGCAGDDDEGLRNVVSILALNDNLPLQADVYNYGQDKLYGTEDDFIPEDFLKIQITSRPHDPALTLNPSKPFGTVRFERYTLDFADNDLNDDGTLDLLDFVDFPMTLVVPINDVGTGFVLAVPGAWKTEPALAALIAGGSYFTTATITLYGTEETSHDKVVLEGGFVIGITNYADEQ